MKQNIQTFQLSKHCVSPALKLGFFSAALAVLLPLGAEAIDYGWTDAGPNRNWNTAANWTNNNTLFPNDVADTATLTKSTNTSLNVNGSWTVQTVTVRPRYTSGGMGGFTVSNTPNNALSIVAGGSVLFNGDSSSAANNSGWTFSCPLTFLGDGNIYSAANDDNGYGRNFNVSGAISGSGTLYIAGRTAAENMLGYSGPQITGNNTNFTGTAIITNGPVVMGHANAFGTNATPVELRKGVFGIGQINTSKPLLVNGITKIVATGNATISGNIVLTNNTTVIIDNFNGGNTRSLSVNGPISGTGNIKTYAQSGGMTFGGTLANTFLGTVQITKEILILNKTKDVDAIPANITIGDSDSAQHILRLGNTNQINDAATVFFGAPSTVSTYSDFRLNGCEETIAGLQSLSNGFGTVENTHATSPSKLTLNTTGNYVFSGVLQDGGAKPLNMVVSGSGVQFMNGKANNTGSWIVNGGTLGGTGTFASAISVMSGGKLAPGQTNGVAGTLVLNNALTNAVGGVLSFDLGTPNVVGGTANDLIMGVVSPALDGTVNVASVTGFGTGHKGDKWRLINYTGTLTGGGLAVGSVPSSTYTLGIDTATSGQVNLVILSNAVTPGTPASPNPTDNATDVAEAGTLDWADCADADGYEVYIWKTTDSKPGTPTATVATSQYALSPALDMGTTYKWQVVATNSAYSAMGAEWTFTTRSNPVPITPDSPSPASSATEVLVSAVLGWANSYGADGYNVYLWKAAESQPGTPTDVVAVNSYNPGGLDYATAYNWQVIATNQYGSSTGLVWSFTTRTHRPFTPATPSPASGATGVSPSTSLSWTCVDADTYQIYVWLSSGTKPGSPTDTVSSPTYTPPTTLIDFTNYTWQVVAVNAFGSEPGPEWTFKTLRTVTARNFVWHGQGADGKWDTLANWVGADEYPRLSVDTVVIMTNLSNRVIDLNGSRTIKSLDIAQSSEESFVINNGTLNIAAGGLIKLTTSGNGPNNQTWDLQCGVNLLGDCGLFNPSPGGYGRALTLSGPITGNNNLYIGGAPGMPQAVYWGVNISGNNTGFVGVVSITNGTAQMGSANAFGTNSMPVVLGTAKLWFYSGGIKPLSVVSNANAVFANYNGSYAGNITIQSNASVYTDNGGGNAMGFSGTLSGSGTLKTSGNGGLTWSDYTLSGNGTNTLANTIVMKGWLHLSKPAGVDAIGGSLTIGETVSNMAAVDLKAANQINDASDVAIVTTGSYLDLANFSDKINNLTLATGTFVKTGTGAGGVLTVKKLTVGASNYPGGVYTSVNAPSFVQGNGSITVRTSGTIILLY
jgi:hypothetical protein